jgi:hypothetical protein
MTNKIKQQKQSSPNVFDQLVVVAIVRVLAVGVQQVHGRNAQDGPIHPSAGMTKRTDEGWEMTTRTQQFEGVPATVYV